MSSHVFSQIPLQVLSKVNYKPKDPPTKRVKFYPEDDKLETVSEGSTDVDVIELEEERNEPTSSNQAVEEHDRQVDKKIEHTQKEEAAAKTKKEGHRDAIIQTERKVLIDIGIQTEESLWTRPLNMTPDDLHRLNMQSFAPIMPMPRLRKGGNEPPLKIGLTLRGRKRKVLYPDDDDYVPPEICSAKGA